MFTEEQKAILIKTAEYMVKRENTSEYSENIRKVAEVALAALTAEPVAYYSPGSDIESPQLGFPRELDEEQVANCIELIAR